MATETPAALVVVPAEVAPGETHPDVNAEAPNPEQEPPSAASPGGEPVNDASCSSASSYSYAELEDKLKQIPPGSPDIMPSAKMFETVETLRLRLEEAEASLSTARKDNEALRVDLAEARRREESTADRLNEAADEMAQLRGREELEVEYQKQVMIRSSLVSVLHEEERIKRDIPSIPPGEEKKLHDKPAP
ncbi:hypothetical protein CK203_082169 [Vitis vinifera]|uniref:Uncharacterized protein n=1 Tax=Vitis vinifera TaxID=29760 RepID=A0A438CN83_VITVI|nr:hypothetical protein CK203_082169 [Vitis vinifera]